MSNTTTSVRRTVNMNISITPENRKFLKMLAVNEGKTVSAMISDWVNEQRLLTSSTASNA